MQLAILSFFFILLISCTSIDNRSEYSWKKIEDITFETGFSTGDIKFFNSNNREYIAFGELRTQLKIVIHEVGGPIVKTIDLSNFMKNESVMRLDYSMISLDSIILLSIYKNRVYLVDDKGDVLHKKNYNSMTYKGQRIELWLPLYFNKNSITCSSMATINDDFPTSPSLNDWRDFGETKKRFPYLFTDKNFFDDSIHKEMKYPNFKSQFTKRNDQALEPPLSCITDSLTILFSHYSDTLYIYTQQGELLKKVKVISKYNPPNCRPRSFDDCRKNMNLINENLQEHGIIARVKHDPYRNFFYCMLYGPKEEKHRPFSIIIYDEGFAPLEEIKINETVYSNFYVGERGVYLKKLPTESFEVNEFTIYRYE